MVNTISVNSSVAMVIIKADYYRVTQENYVQFCGFLFPTSEEITHVLKRYCSARLCFFRSGTQTCFGMLHSVFGRDL